MARILAVDDNEDNVFLLRMILENHHHEVLTAYSGAEALAVAAQTPPDLVLLDLMMPEMDGLEVARRLKERPETRHVPVILLTAKKKEVSDVVHALDSGADEYITKPFHETELVARVKSMLRMKALFDQIEQDRRLMEEDLKMAERVQANLLPSVFPYPGSIRFTTYYEATATVGGDFYDVLDFGGGKVGAIIADVSGHGASAALIVAMIKTLLIAQADHQPDPARIVKALNTRLSHMTPEERYCTIFMGIVDLAANQMTYVRAGHPPPFLLRAGGGLRRLDAGGDLVGMFNDISLELETVPFGPGDKLVAYSDGLFELANPKGERYGLERLEGDIAAAAGQDATGLLNGLVNKVKAFAGQRPIEDDIAALVAERL